MKIIDTFLTESHKQFTIYLDLDGVLVDFEKAFLKLGAGSFDSVREKNPSLCWILIARKGVSFWSTAQWMPDGKELWNYVKQYPVKILSAPIKAKSSVTGKNIWVDKNLGDDVERILVPRKEKQKFAGPDAILIDDMEENIKEWRLAGGIAIHHTDTESTIKKLKVIL